MELKDFQSGDVVQVGTGVLYMYFEKFNDRNNVFSEIGVSGWASGIGMGSNLTHEPYNESLDIMKVYRPRNVFNLGSHDIENYTVIWERNKEVTVTMDEIAEWKGVSVNDLKVIKE